MIKVYFENPLRSAELVALFDDDETYNDCLPALEAKAKEQGFECVTESVTSTPLFPLEKFAGAMEDCIDSEIEAEYEHWNERGVKAEIQSNFHAFYEVLTYCIEADPRAFTMDCVKAKDENGKELER